MGPDQQKLVDLGLQCLYLKRLSTIFEKKSSAHIACLSSITLYDAALMENVDLQTIAYAVTECNAG